MNAADVLVNVQGHAKIPSAIPLPAVSISIQFYINNGAPSIEFINNGTLTPGLFLHGRELTGRYYGEFEDATIIPRRRVKV